MLSRSLWTSLSICRTAGTCASYCQGRTPRSGDPFVLPAIAGFTARHHKSRSIFSTSSSAVHSRRSSETPWHSRMRRSWGSWGHKKEDFCGPSSFFVILIEFRVPIFMAFLTLLTNICVFVHACVFFFFNSIVGSDAGDLTRGISRGSAGSSPVAQWALRK